MAAAIDLIAEAAWTSAYDADGQVRDGAGWSTRPGAYSADTEWLDAEDRAASVGSPPLPICANYTPMVVLDGEVG